LVAIVPVAMLVCGEVDKELARYARFVASPRFHRRFGRPDRPDAVPRPARLMHAGPPSGLGWICILCFLSTGALNTRDSYAHSRARRGADRPIFDVPRAAGAAAPV